MPLICPLIKLSGLWQDGYGFGERRKQSRAELEVLSLTVPFHNIGSVKQCLYDSWKFISGNG